MREDGKHEGRIDGWTNVQAGRQGEANSRFLQLSNTPNEIF